MAMCSQIYVMVDGELVIANFYDWNYGQFMVSRARYGIEYLAKNIDNPWMYRRDRLDLGYETSRRYWDVDFDTKCIDQSMDMLTKDRNMFDWDTDDGRLFVMVNSKEKEIKYCFTDNCNKLMNVDQYLNWDLDVQHWRTWDIRGWNDHTRNVCSGNTNRIKKLAKLMTQEELDAFLKLGGERA